MGIAQLDRVLTDQQISAIVDLPQHADRRLPGSDGKAGHRCTPRMGTARP